MKIKETIVQLFKLKAERFINKSEAAKDDEENHQERHQTSDQGPDAHHPEQQLEKVKLMYMVIRCNQVKFENFIRVNHRFIVGILNKDELKISDR